MENIKASTVFQVQWLANSENYNAAASVISQGKRVFQQVNDSFRRDTVLADTIQMLRISRNARIKTKSLVGIGVNTFSIGGIGTRCTASTNARTRFRNRNAFGTYPFETKGAILTVAFSEELKFLSALRTARLGYIFKEINQFALLLSIDSHTPMQMSSNDIYTLLFRMIFFSRFCWYGFGRYFNHAAKSEKNQ